MNAVALWETLRSQPPVFVAAVWAWPFRHARTRKTPGGTTSPAQRNYCAVSGKSACSVPLAGTVNVSVVAVL